MRARYLAIEGPPGVGKTGLVERLADRLDAAVVADQAAANPFLRDFYQNKPGAAFQAQIFSLLSRYRRLSEQSQRDLFHQTVVADFILEKDKIYAYLNLDDTELMLYEKIFRVLAGEVPAPELVVYLQAPAETLARRLRATRRRTEPGPDEAYLAELVKAYDYFFFHYAATPLLVVNCTDVDFSDPEVDLADLLREMDTLTGGTRYYVPARGR